MNEEPYIIKEYKKVYFIFKPAGWSCATHEYYVKLNKDKEDYLILDWIRKNLKVNKNVSSLEYQYGLLNRLDTETSGIVLVAKNLKDYEEYYKNISDHIKTTKIYVALVDGEVPHEFGVISSKLLYNERIRKNFVNNKYGKFAYTEYVKIKTYEYENRVYSLLLVKIKTGRTHQIRVHFGSIGHNIFCDKKYQMNREELEKQCNLSKRLFLHSTYYKIENDVDGYVNIPEDLSNTIDMMKTKDTFMTMDNGFSLLKSNCFTKAFLSSMKKSYIKKNLINKNNVDSKKNNESKK